MDELDSYIDLLMDDANPLPEPTLPDLESLMDTGVDVVVDTNESVLMLAQQLMQEVQRPSSQWYTRTTTVTRT